ncbi:MAG: hypothetical protein HC858_10800 [Brachymonas sp.]|nr:hypothetical protein [Brachymonas sp.]
MATTAWLAVLVWRAGRHRSAVWKSLVLPATGAVMSWVLLTTLWMPMLNQGRSYAPLVARVQVTLAQHNFQQGDCVAEIGLTPAQRVAMRFHGQLTMRPVSENCRFMVGDADALRELPLAGWQELQSYRRRGSADVETLVLYRRAQP